MPIQRHVTRIETDRHEARFSDGTVGTIVQWMDRDGSFHEEPVADALALIVRDPVDGYQTVDLRTAEAAGRC